MPTVTATPARIARSVRESEFARSSNSTVLVNNPDADDGYASPRESFFDATADAQVLLDETANILMSPRYHIGVETDTPFKIGSTIALWPSIPRARVVDRDIELDKTMLIKAVAIDLHVDRNSIELVG